VTHDEPWALTTDDDGTVNRLWRVEDPEAIACSRKCSPTPSC